jgi:CheY-like chemotaxis protein
MLDFGSQRQLPRILLIDDDLVSREVLATVLTMSGYTVHTAADGAASLAVLDQGECKPDVILMDSQMPGLSGTGLMKELRTRTPASLFVMSGSHASDAVVEAADGFLLKPFGAEALQRLLEKHGPLDPASQSPRLETPVIDARMLACLREMMAETQVREIYAAIVMDLNLRILALEAAIANHDAAEIRRIGHAIKGGSAMAGATQVAAVGALLESGGDQSDNWAATMSDLRAACRNLQSMLEADFQA